METRTIALNLKDVQNLSEELERKGKDFSPEQRQFWTYIVSRAQSGAAVVKKDDAAWTWTWRF